MQYLLIFLCSICKISIFGKVNSLIKNYIQTTNSCISNHFIFIWHLVSNSKFISKFKQEGELVTKYPSLIFYTLGNFDEIKQKMYNVLSHVCFPVEWWMRKGIMWPFFWLSVPALLDEVKKFLLCTRHEYFGGKFKLKMSRGEHLLSQNSLILSCL